MLEKFIRGLVLGQVVLWALVGPEYLATITSRPIPAGVEAFVSYIVFFTVGAAVLTIPGFLALHFGLQSQQQAAPVRY